jgi:hypothetical protein
MGAQAQQNPKPHVPLPAELRQNFCHPLADVAAKYGMCINTMKRLCRKVRNALPLTFLIEAKS